MNPALILNIVMILAKSGLLEKLLPVAGEIFANINKPPEEQPRLDVRWLQQSMNTLVGTALVVDGSYGEETRKAVRKFQIDFMPFEAADGWAGVKTTAAILQALEQRK